MDPSYRGFFKSVGAATVASTLLVSLGKLICPHYFVYSNLCFVTAVVSIGLYDYQSNREVSMQSKKRMMENEAHAVACRKLSRKNVRITEAFMEDEEDDFEEDRVSQKKSLVRSKTLNPNFMKSC